MATSQSDEKLARSNEYCSPGAVRNKGSNDESNHADFSNYGTDASMNKFFLLHLPVFGKIGDGSLWDKSVDRPVVLKLHYEFDFKPDSDLFKTYPVFIATLALANSLATAGFSGFEAAPMRITTSDTYRHLYPGNPEPSGFCWLKIKGRPLDDDFGVHTDFMLAVSERAFDHLTRFQLRDFLKYDASAPPSRDQLEKDLFEQARK